MTNLTPAERQLITRLLNLAADKFSYHSCNDFDLDFLPPEDRHTILQELEEWKGTPEDYDKNQSGSMDWLLMKFMAYRTDSAEYDFIKVAESEMPKARIETIEHAIQLLVQWSQGETPLTLGYIRHLIEDELARHWQRLKLNSGKQPKEDLR